MWLPKMQFGNEIETLKIFTNMLYSENTAKNQIWAAIIKRIGKFCTGTTHNIDSL